MRARLLTSIFSLFFCSLAFAGPVDTVYLERFDPPSGPDSVSTYNTNPLQTNVWNDTTNLWVSPTASYHTRIAPFDSVIFETDTFSTVGNVFVRLRFNQICKIHSGQRGYIQASNDGGVTWSNVTGSMYQGNSPQFGALGYFNEMSYPSAQLTPFWEGPTLSQATIVNPTNSWWSEETMDISTILGGTNGYAYCKIRFIARHVVNLPYTLPGWYVDNLLVEAAPCELEPPTYTFNINPYRKPDGARYNASQEVRLKARDNTGIDSVLVHWSLNNGTWQSTEMTALTSGSCPDSSIYTHTWSNLVLYDTIKWYVEIFDCACPNITRDPIDNAIPNFYTFWRDLAPPAICGATYPASFPKVVTSLPYLEGFENTSLWGAGTGSGNTGTAHRGDWPTENPPDGENWTVSPNPVTTGFAWSIRTGGTATGLTGPSGSNGGSQYIYTEASQGNGSNGAKFAQVITPCIDLTNVSCAALEFYYHMYGSDIDRIRIDVDTGTATSKYVTAVAVLIGQAQANSNQPYKKAFVSLEQFSGRIIRIRFAGRKNTSVSQDKNDMAIDDIQILEPTPVDVEMTNYYTPQNGYCSYSSTEVVTGKLQSLGCQTLTAIPIACRIEHTSPSMVVSNTIIRDTLYGSYPLGSDTSFSFAPTADLSAYGSYNLWIWSEAVGDTVQANDTVGPYFIEHRQPVTGFPYILDFDGAATIPGNGTQGNPGTTGTDDWERIPDPSNGGYAFHVMTGKTPSAATGPRTDYSQHGNYIYTEGNFGSAPVSAIFASKCVSLVGMTNPVLDFMYHMFGTDIGAIAIQIVPANSNNWINVPGGSISATADKHTSSIQDWKHWSINLSSWAGQVIKIRFIGQKTGVGAAADIAIDDIHIFDKITTDVGILSISNPPQRIDLTNPSAPQFVIQNFGSSSTSSIPIIYTVTPSCGPNAGVPTTYNYTYPGSIAAGAKVTVTLPAASIPTFPEGTFDFCVTTNKTGDSHSFNNEYCKSSVGWPEHPIQTGFAEDFDNCNNGTESGFWLRGDYRTFTFGTGGGASSSPNAFGTHAFPYNSYPNTNEYLQAPKFVGFDTIVGAQLWFRHKFQFGSGDVGVVETQSSGAWQILGFQDPDDEIGINWYNGANLPAVSNGSGFVLNSASWPGNTNGWITSMWPLNIYNFSSSPLVLRWNQVSAGGGTVGWTIDDVEVRIPPQNSASPYDIDFEGNYLFPNIPATLLVRVQNTGAKQLDSCMVSFSVDGGAFSAPEKVVFDPILITGKVSREWYTFNQLWQNPLSGAHTICVVTSRPNNKGDNFTVDDTLCLQFKVLDEFIFDRTTNDTSYCNNFDDPAQNPWIEQNTSNKKGLVSWQVGTPNQAPIVGAHSAPNAWMTKLNNNYKTRDSSSLVTPVFVSDSGDVFDISFWHNFKTELYHDGGTVDISFDGKTFRTVGYVLPDSVWFTTNHVTALDVVDPGWSGESGGWIQSKIKIQFDQDRKSLLRFRFASDQSFEYQGWAIDDFCMNLSSGEPDDFIGIEDLNDSEYIDVGNIIPNPSNGQTRIPFFMNSPSDVKVTGYNMLGQQMMTFVNQSEPGINNLEFDVTNWSPGMYIIAIEVNGEQITRKMMVR